MDDEVMEDGVGARARVESRATKRGKRQTTMRLMGTDSKDNDDAGMYRWYVCYRAIYRAIYNGVSCLHVR